MNKHTVVKLGILMLALSAIFLGIPIAGAAPVANDDFNRAIAISQLPFNDTRNTTKATTAADDPFPSCGGGRDATVWYSLTAAQNLVVDTSTAGSSYAAMISIYTGARGALSPVTCGYPSARFAASANQTYFIMVSVFAGPYPTPGGTGGTLTFSMQSVPAPANDNFASATQIGGLPFTDNTDISGATRQAGEPFPSCAYSEPTGSVWYAITPAASGSLSAFVSGQFTPVAAVYTGGALASLAEHACLNYPGTFTFQASAGVTYYIQISGLVGQTSQLEFQLDVTPPPQAGFFFYPFDPSLFDTIQFFDTSFDPGQVGFQSYEWNFGDGATATGCCVTHQYANDGDYTVQLTVTTTDGQTATTSQVVHVETHDVAILQLSAPNSARAGQVRQISVGVNSKRYPETVQVQLFKSDPASFDGFLLVETLVQPVPVRSANRTTTFNFNYTFTSDDARIGKVTFKAVATIYGPRDALPADNQAIAAPTKVTR